MAPLEVSRRRHLWKCRGGALSNAAAADGAATVVVVDVHAPSSTGCDRVIVLMVLPTSLSVAAAVVVRLVGC